MLLLYLTIGGSGQRFLADRWLAARPLGAGRRGRPHAAAANLGATAH